MTKRAGGKEIAPVFREGRVDVESESTQIAVTVIHGARHRFDGERREHADVAEPATAEDHLAELGEIVGCRKESRVPGDPSQSIGAGVMHLAAHPAAVTLL